MFDYLENKFAEIKSYNSVKINENLDSWACTGFENFPEARFKNLNCGEISGSERFSGSIFLEHEDSQNLSDFGFDQNDVMSEDDDLI